jgi:hypothetical protein
MKSKADFGNARIQRWMEKIQQYNFTIEYRKGEEMLEADALSRTYKEKMENNEPTMEQAKVIKEIHEKIGHRGVDATEYALLNEYTKWPCQKEHIKDVIKNCETCVRNKVIPKGGSMYVETQRKLQKLGIDILEYKETYLLIGIDYFTRYAWGTVLKSKNSREIANVLYAWFKKIGNPEEIITDAGLEFNNKILEEMCERRGIRRHIISTDNHKSNGRVERLNRTLREYFRKSENSMKTVEILGKAINHYNISLHKAIEMTPSEAWNNENIEKLKKQNTIECAYAKSFKKGQRKNYIKGQIVALKELPKRKENQNFGKTGKILETTGRDSYYLKTGDKIEKRIHSDMNLMPIRI